MTRLLIMLTLTSSFFIVELVVGYMVNSIALIADSFHMLSDVLSLLVAMYAIRVCSIEPVVIIHLNMPSECSSRNESSGQPISRTDGNAPKCLGL